MLYCTEVVLHNSMQLNNGNRVLNDHRCDTDILEVSHQKSISIRKVVPWNNILQKMVITQGRVLSYYLSVNNKFT